MELVAAAVLANVAGTAGAVGASAVVAGVVAAIVARSTRRDAVHAGGPAVTGSRDGGTVTRAQATAGSAPDAGAGAAIDPAAVRAAHDGLEAELRERRSEIARIEERLLAKEEAIDARANELQRRETSLEDRARNLEVEAERLKQAKHDQLRELERVSATRRSRHRNAHA